MKRPFDYRVSLRVKHPVWSSAEICRRLQRTARYSWTAGEPRITPKGTSLGGFRKESYCSFDIGEGEDGELAFCLRSAVNQLEHRSADIGEFNASGGELMFYVFWYPNGDTGEEFDAELLLDMAKLGIILGVNVYDDRQNPEG